VFVITNCPNPLHVNDHLDFFHFANSIDPLCLVDHPNVFCVHIASCYNLFHVAFTMVHFVFVLIAFILLCRLS